MVKLNKIYTRTGDDGTTGLVRGPRRKKHDLRVEAYGTVDELNAFVGLARCHCDSAEIDADLARIQNDLFDLGSDLATPGPDGDREAPSLRVTAGQVGWLEARIDSYNARLEPLTSFVLPGGRPLAAALHAARTVARRAERIDTALKDVETDISPITLAYLNRLSDFLFVLARIANADGAEDVLWAPGRHSDAQKPS